MNSVTSQPTKKARKPPQIPKIEFSEVERAQKSIETNKSFQTGYPHCVWVSHLDVERKLHGTKRKNSNCSTILKSIKPKWQMVDLKTVSLWTSNFYRLVNGVDLRYVRS